MIFRTTQLLLCMSLAMPVIGQANADTILRKSGKHLTKLKIVKLERDKITYSKGGKPATIDTILVSSYQFGSAPESYTRGHSAANRGRHLAAAKFFDEAASATKVAAIKNAATYFCGRSFALAARKNPSHANNAVARLQAYIDTMANGYYIPEAKVMLAQACLAGGDAAGAEAMLTALESEAKTNAWPLFRSAQIMFTKAQAQYAQKNYAAARASYQHVDGAVASALGQSSEFNTELQGLKTEALIKQGETYIGEKAYADALAYYQGLALNNSPGVKAAAQTGKGQILFIQGVNKNDKAKLRQAQLALAAACIEPDTSDFTSAKALFFMGKVLAALGDDEKNGAGRAKTYFQSVKNNYGTTEWAAKARQELDG